MSIRFGTVFYSAMFLLFAVPAGRALAAPDFQMPFPCNQVWTGSTWSGHNPLYAVDLNRPDDLGDTVVASAGGTVTTSAYSTTSGYGNYIIIDHGGGWQTLYAHLQSRDVSRGASVSRGQRIGTVGNTSATASIGVHLHYEQRYSGTVRKIVWNGNAIPYYVKQNYTSRNCSSGGAATGTVRTSGVNLNVRAGPSTDHAIVGSLANGTTVTIQCQTRGESITGTYGTSTLWNRIGSGRFIPDAYTYTGSDGRVAPDC
ncbi:peptidoglycan DD-metalloendopeptidase family protein [Lysobacter hankyongensis]|uniref:Peptidoglycan DD-metalloendopeptidase family protein n=1 Tax=Lysobacter hankyongensis TaxID=1176535 RepID=A0ABP9C1I1_9GAMM